MPNTSKLLVEMVRSEDSPGEIRISDRVSSHIGLMNHMVEKLDLEKPNLNRSGLAHLTSLNIDDTNEGQ